MLLDIRLNILKMVKIGEMEAFKK